MIRIRSLLALVASVALVLTLTAPGGVAQATVSVRLTHLTVGNGFCDGPPGAGDMCHYSGDSGGNPSGKLADWTGDNTIASFPDWHYSGLAGDSPNDEVSYIINFDGQAQWVFKNSGPTDPRSCFLPNYISSDTKGMENADSALQPRTVTNCL